MRRLRTFAVALAAAALLTFPLAPVVTIAAPAPTIVAIAAGGQHACGLTAAGGVKCWGVNVMGELGDGTTIDRPRPVDVKGLASGVIAIASGTRHTCALTAAGGVKCWGWNGDGELGNGTTISSSVPVDVSGLASGVIAIAAGTMHSCAVTTSGAVKCWGDNHVGQLGDGTRIASLAPVDVVGLSGDVSAIFTRAYHTCVLTVRGGVKCWGYNGEGELGNGTTTIISSIPVDVSGLASGVTTISAGIYHTCALTTAGGVKCWGANDRGQLGDGRTTSSRIPVDVSGLASGVTTITAAGYHACAITTAAGVRCWGWNVKGQLGNGTTISSRVPVDVLGLASGVTTIGGGDCLSCAAVSSGGAKCWGDGIVLGSGWRIDSSVPLNVDFSVHQTIALRGSKPAGRIARGTTVTFTATVSPRSPAGTPVVVRFVVYSMIGVAFDGLVTADASGQARLRWTFSTAGSWKVHASAKANAAYGASAWSPLIWYTVR